MDPSPALDPDPSSLSFAGFLLQASQVPELDYGVFAVLFGVFVFLLLASAVFSGSEVALFSLDERAKADLDRQADRAGRRVLKLLEKPRSLLITILVLNTLVNVAAAILGAIMTHDVAQAYGWSPSLTVLLEVILLTFVLLVVSEITPKLIATRHAVRYSRLLSWPLGLLFRLMYPLSGALARAMVFTRGLFPETRGVLSGEDLKTMAEIGEAHGTLEEEERLLIHSIVEFGETRRGWLGVRIQPARRACARSWSAAWTWWPCR